MATGNSCGAAARAVSPHLRLYFQRGSSLAGATLAAHLVGLFVLQACEGRCLAGSWPEPYSGSRLRRLHVGKAALFVCPCYVNFPLVVVAAYVCKVTWCVLGAVLCLNCSQCLRRSSLLQVGADRGSCERYACLSLPPVLLAA